MWFYLKDAIYRNDDIDYLSKEWFVIGKKESLFLFLLVKKSDD